MGTPLRPIFSRRPTTHDPTVNFLAMQATFRIAVFGIQADTRLNQPNAAHSAPGVNHMSATVPGWRLSSRRG